MDDWSIEILTCNRIFTGAFKEKRSEEEGDPSTDYYCDAGPTDILARRSRKFNGDFYF